MRIDTPESFTLRSASYADAIVAASRARAPECARLATIVSAHASGSPLDVPNASASLRCISAVIWPRRAASGPKSPPVSAGSRRLSYTSRNDVNASCQPSEPPSRNSRTTARSIPSRRHATTGALMCAKPTRARPSVISTSGFGPSANRRHNFMMKRSSYTTDVFDISTLSERTRCTTSSGAIELKNARATTGSTSASYTSAGPWAVSTSPRTTRPLPSRKRSVWSSGRRPTGTWKRAAGPASNVASATTHTSAGHSSFHTSNSEISTPTSVRSWAPYHRCRTRKSGSRTARSLASITVVASLRLHARFVEREPVEAVRREGDEVGQVADRREGHTPKGFHRHLARIIGQDQLDRLGEPAQVVHAEHDVVLPVVAAHVAEVGEDRRVDGRQ